LAALGETPGQRLAVVLAGLALQDASGVLEIDGEPSGRVYLHRGQITFAQAAGVPGIGARLLARSEPCAQVRTLLTEDDDPDRDLGAVLTEARQLTRAGVRALLKSAVTDALIALIVPLKDHTSVAGTRFLASQSHWSQSYGGVPVEAACALAVKRAAPLAKCGGGAPDATALPEIHCPSRRPRQRSRAQGRASQDEPARTAEPAEPPKMPEPRKANGSGEVQRDDPALTDPSPELSAPSADQLRRVLDGLRRL
jgi:hypothetical protein